jgi:hypothetical protein
MDNFIENSDEDKFAYVQSSRDLRVNSDAREPETQLEVVNAIEQYPGVAPEEFPAPIGNF